MWHFVILRRGVPLFSLHGGRPLRLLALLAVGNSSIWIMLTFTYGARQSCAHACAGACCCA